MDATKEVLGGGTDSVRSLAYVKAKMLLFVTCLCLCPPHSCFYRSNKANNCKLRIEKTTLRVQENYLKNNQDMFQHDST